MQIFSTWEGALKHSEQVSGESKTANIEDILSSESSNRSSNGIFDRTFF